MLSIRQLFPLRQAARSVRRPVQGFHHRQKWRQLFLQQHASVRFISSEVSKDTAVNKNELSGNTETLSPLNNEDLVREEMSTDSEIDKDSSEVKVNTPISNTFLCISRMLESNNAGGKTEAQEIYSAVLKASNSGEKQEILKVFISTMESVILKHSIKSSKDVQALLDCKEMKDMLSNILESLSLYSEHELVNILACQMDFKILSQKQEGVLWGNLLSHVNRLSMSSLVRVYDASSKSRACPGAREIIFRNICRRWMEIEKGNEIISVMNVMFKENEQTSDSSMLNHLEEKALQKAETLSADEIRQILASLAKVRRRSLPLIKALVYCIKENMTEGIPLSSVASILTSLSRLNFHDPTLLGLLSDRVSKMAEELGDNWTSKDFINLSAILVSCAHLRWLKPSVEKVFLSRFPEFQSHLNQTQLCHAICSMSKLQCLASSEKEAVMKMVESLSTSNVRETSPVLWMNLALALGWSDFSSEAVLTSVLQQDFVNIIQDKFPAMTSSLRQLEYETTLAFPNFQGPKLNIRSFRPNKTSKSEPLVEDVIEITRVLDRGMEDGVQTRVCTPQGHEIDALVLADNTGKVIPFSSTTGANVHKVAIKVLRYQNVIQPGRKPTGDITLCVRHLKSLGYKVVLIPYYSWKNVAGNSSKLMFLTKAISDSIRQ